jgi:Na+/H+-dicarboxylate symporter
MKLSSKITVGLILGCLSGVILGKDALFFKPIGDLFLNALKMLIIPLIFSSLIVSVSNFKDTHRLGRIAVKSFLLFLLCTTLAVSIAFAVGLIFKTGSGLNMTATSTLSATPVSIIDLVVSIIPQNPVAAFASGNLLQIVIFTIFLAISIVLAGSHAKPVSDFFVALSKIMEKLTSIVMQFSPYGIFALIATLVGSMGLTLILPLLKTILVALLASGIHVVVVYGGLVTGIARLNPITFISKIWEGIIIAFTTTSAAAALPSNLKSTQENLDISPEISGFVLPLGSVVNKGGTVIYHITIALFIAQAFQIDLSASQYITIALITIISSFGTPSISGAGLIILTAILTSANLPVEGIALVAGIDRIFDMIRTPVNIIGDCVVALVVSKTDQSKSIT